MTEELPEWIRVWRWYRAAHPGDVRLFPQQAHYVGDPLLDYDAVRALWLARDGKPAAAVGADDEFFAFMSALPPVPP